MITIYTDGSSRQANGIWHGAYGVIVYDGDTAIKKISQLITPGTNNVCEMAGVLRALTIIKENYADQHVVIVTDSQYTIGGLTTATPYKTNTGLWNILRSLYQELDVEVRWTRGHDRDTKNHDVDDLAYSTLKDFFDKEGLQP